MMRLKKTLEVPPDGHRYTFPDGTVIRQAVYSDWLNAIKNHYEWNGIPRPDNWVQIAEDQLCLLLPSGWCKQVDGSDVMQHIDVRLHAFQIYHGAVTLANVVKEGPDALVPIEQAEARAAVCSSCPANVHVEGCLPCLKISDVIMSVTGPKRTTTSDPFLRSCACCGCPTSAAVHVKSEILAKAVTDQMEARFALCKDWCWQYRERHPEAIEQAEQG